MTEDVKDVNEVAEPSSEPSAEEVKQDPIVSEDVKPQESEVESNLKKALQAERERRKDEQKKREELEARLADQNYTQTDNSDEAYQRFLKVEAETKITSKMLNDPTFKERVDLVKDTMERTGYDVDMADAIVKAQIYDQLIKESPKGQEKSEPPKQFKNQPIQEAV